MKELMELTQTEAYIKQEEGYRRHMYKCPSGKWTIGIGLNLEAGLPEDEAEAILRLRLDKLKAQLGAELPWFSSLNEARQATLVSMAYQMGLRGLYGFRRMLAAIEGGDYETAGREMLDSTWARQTPARARRTAEMMRSGRFVTGR